MKHFILYLILSTPAFALVGGTEAVLPPKDFFQSRPDVGRGWFPSLVLLNMAGEMCTGTVLSKYLILTAAHCAVKEEKDRSFTRNLGRGKKLRFYAGVDFDKVTYTHTRTIRYTYIHPSYFYSKVGGDTAQIAADIALIAVVEPIEDIPPAALDLKPFLPSDYAIKTGFGCESLKDSEFFLSSQWRLKFDIDAKGVPNQEEAFSRAQRDPFIAEIRTLIDDFYTGTRGLFYDEDERLAKPATLCSGDSGGPLFKFNEETKQAGVAGVNSRSRLNPSKEDEAVKQDKVVLDLHTRLDDESALRIDQWLERALALDGEGKGSWHEGIHFDKIYPRAADFKTTWASDVKKGMRIPGREWVVEISGADKACPVELTALTVTARKSSGGAVDLLLLPHRQERVSGQVQRTYYRAADGEDTYVPSRLKFRGKRLEAGDAPICYVTTSVVN